MEGIRNVKRMAGKHEEWRLPGKAKGDVKTKRMERDTLGCLSMGPLYHGMDAGDQSIGRLS